MLKHSVRVLLPLVYTKRKKWTKRGTPSTDATSRLTVAFSLDVDGDRWVVISQKQIMNLQREVHDGLFDDTVRRVLYDHFFLLTGPQTIASTPEWVSNEYASGISPVQQWSLHVAAYDCICSSTGTLPPIAVLTH